jgi:hypothetical protein
MCILYAFYKCCVFYPLKFLYWPQSLKVYICYISLVIHYRYKQICTPMYCYIHGLYGFMKIYIY